MVMTGSCGSRGPWTYDLSVCWLTPYHETTSPCPVIVLVAEDILVVGSELILISRLLVRSLNWTRRPTLEPNCLPDRSCFWLWITSCVIILYALIYMWSFKFQGNLLIYLIFWVGLELKWRLIFSYWVPFDIDSFLGLGRSQIVLHSLYQSPCTNTSQ